VNNDGVPLVRNLQTSFRSVRDLLQEVLDLFKILFEFLLVVLGVLNFCDSVDDVIAAVIVRFELSVSRAANRWNECSRNLMGGLRNQPTNSSGSVIPRILARGIVRGKTYFPQQFVSLRITEVAKQLL